MNENYRTLLEAAFPSTIVRSWQMLPASEKLSHSTLAVLITINETLNMDDRIRYLELLKEECKDLFIDSDLIPLIDNQISMDVGLYHEFIKPGPRIIYSTSLIDGVYCSTIDKIIEITQEYINDGYGYDETIRIIRSYIDAKSYEKDIIAYYDSSGKLRFLRESYPEFESFLFNGKPIIAKCGLIAKGRNQITINHFFRPGDAVFNIITKETGIVEEVRKLCLIIKLNRAISGVLETWDIPYIEYDI